MRKYIYCILLLLLVSLGMVSCTEHEFEGVGYDNGQYIRIRTSCVNLGATRAEGDAENTMAGVEELNENLIQTIHYFLYPKGGTDANAVLKGKLTNIGKHGSATIDIPLVEDVLNNDLFPGTNRECEVYLIANFSGTTDLENLVDTRLATLKAIAIADFYNGTVEDGVRSLATYQKQNSFVMDGQGKVTLDDRSQQVVAKGDIITLKRFAAKYTVCVSTENFIEEVKDADGNITAQKEWTPVLDEMEVRVENVVSNSTLAGTFGTDLFDYAARTNKSGATKTSEEGTTYQVFDPFYSYPCQWQIHEDDAFAMYIELPWVHDKGDGTSEETKCLYKVIPNTTQLNRNTWYNIDLNIGVLSINPEEVNQVINIEGTCTIEDWNNGNSDWEFGYKIDSEIKGARYLIVEQNEYVVNNKNEFEIPFITSHPCEIVGLSVYRTVFGNEVDDKPEPEYMTISTPNGNNNVYYQLGANQKDFLKVEGSSIKLCHTLNNDFASTTDYDYSPYIFTFTVRHKDNEDFNEEIKVTQKPALSIYAQLNSYREANPNGTYGYVYVNGYNPNSKQSETTGGGGFWGGGTDYYDNVYGGVGGLTGSGNNKNPYMYTIEVSVLPDGSDFILGDPRVEYDLQSLDIDNYVDAPHISNMDGGEKSLRKYYGTDKSTSVENMIAPKFRMASSHGWVSGEFISYTNAFNRAATYQEDGYPAGRWRVPTKAEVWFVAKLFADKKIPPLFNSGTGYWCASGKVTPNDNGSVEIGNATGTCAIRCVYDEWYWEHSTLRLPEEHFDTFTWGDEI